MSCKTDRDRLILDITKSDKKTNEKCRNCTDPKGSSTYCAKCSCEQLADNLIADGWIKPPCKVGDSIYRVGNGEIWEWLIEHIEIYEDEMVFIDDSENVFVTESIGETVFLTKEEAEEKLRERSEKV